MQHGTLNSQGASLLCQATLSKDLPLQVLDEK